MRYQYLKIGILFFLLNIEGIFAYQTCSLSKDFHGTKLTPCLYLLSNTNDQFTEKDALHSLLLNHFVPVVGVPTATLRQQHWLKLTITQDFESELTLMLKFSDLRGAWLIQNEELIAINYAGYLPSYDNLHQSVLKDNHRVVFSLNQKDTLTFLFKTFPKYLERGEVVPFIYDFHQYERETHTLANISTLLNGIVLGIMILFLSISILVFFLYREKSYLAYIFYLVFVITYLWRDFEYLNLFFFSTMKFVAWHETKLIMNCLIGCSYIIFIKLLLNTKSLHPKVDKILNIFLVLLIISIPIDYIGSEWMNWWHYKVGMYYAGGIALVTQIFYNAYFIRDKDPVVRYIVLGTFFLTLGAISIPLFDVSIHTWVVRICFILEMIFFTAALSQKIKKMYKERARVKNELKETQIRYEYETQIKLSQERQATEEKIRNDIARDIHDEIGAALTKISLSTHILSKSDKIIDADTKNKILKIGADATQTHKQLRQLLFSINPSYDNFEVVQLYFNEIATFYFSDTNIQVEFLSYLSDANPKMDRIVKSQLLLILKESLHNIVKHAQASKVIIALNLIDQSNYQLLIKDNGIGFDDVNIKTFSSGLKNMEIRAQKINAHLSIKSTPKDGTEISVSGSVH
jgi:signal transduction histidine kinase